MSRLALIALAALALGGCEQPYPKDDDVYHRQIVIPEETIQWTCKAEGEELYRGPSMKIATLICEKRKGSIIRMIVKPGLTMGYIDPETNTWAPQVCDTYGSGQTVCGPASFDKAMPIKQFRAEHAKRKAEIEREYGIKG